jgi:hypothetical protein
MAEFSNNQEPVNGMDHGKFKDQGSNISSFLFMAEFANAKNQFLGRVTVSLIFFF